MIYNNFEITQGTTPGYSHLDSYKGNQDGISSFYDDQMFVGVITDGCSSTPYPEVGSKMFANIIAREVYLQYPKWDVIKNNILDAIKIMFVGHKAKDMKKFVHDYFLFTIMGFVIIPATNTILIFSFGDGSYGLIKKFVNLDSWAMLGYEYELDYTSIDQNNTPTYIAYDMISTTAKNAFNINYISESNEHYGFIIGSDGIDYLEKNKGKEYRLNKTVPGLLDLYQNDKIFENETLLTKKLQALTKHRILYDDTSMFMIRRTTGFDWVGEVE